MGRVTGLEPAHRTGHPNGFEDHCGRAPRHCQSAAAWGDCASEYQPRSPQTLHPVLVALNAQAPELLPWAVEGYFWHCWKQQFPDAPAKVDGDSKASPEVQREWLLRALRKLAWQWLGIERIFHPNARCRAFNLFWRTGLHEPWQTLQSTLKAKFEVTEVELLTKKDIFRQAAKFDFIDDTERWFGHYDTRNETSHIYDNAIAEATFARSR
jgi:Nucleotidyltransferase substrate binding protein like